MNWSYAELVEAPDSLVGEIIEMMQEQARERAR